MDKIDMYMEPDDLPEQCPISLEEIKTDSRAMYQTVFYGKTALTQAEKKYIMEKKWTISGDISPKWITHSKKYNFDGLYEWVVVGRNTKDPLTRERFSKYLIKILQFKHKYKEIFVLKGGYTPSQKELYAILRGTARDDFTRVNTQLVHLPFLVTTSRETTNAKLLPGEWLIRASRVMGSMFFRTDTKELVPRDGFYVMSFNSMDGKMRHLPFKHIYGHGYVRCKYERGVPVVLLTTSTTWYPCIVDLVMYYMNAYDLDITKAVSTDMFAKRL